MRLSVVIPAYNRATLLPATLRSLISQTLPADEIIVVDDGSTDHTVRVAEAFGAPVRVVRQKNAGPAVARNRGLAEAQGEYIHFFDSDDLAVPNKHAAQLTLLERTGADIACSPWVKGTWDEGGAFVDQGRVLQQKGLPRGDLAKALLTSWSIVPQACLFRRSIVEQCHGFPEHLRVAEDQLLFLRCLLQGAKVVHAPETLMIYRAGDHSKLSGSKGDRSDQFRDWATFLIEAHAEMKALGRSPEQWAGFRLRAWQAARDLQSCSGNHTSRLAELNALTGGTPAWRYRWIEVFSQKMGGLRQRTTGGREPQSFRASRLTRDQRATIAATLGATHE